MERADTGTIVAGSGKDSMDFVVPTFVLQRSPVINDWIEDPGSLPDSLKKDGSLNLENISPDVVAEVIRFLEDPEAFECLVFEPPNERAIFYTKVYKLALSLGVETLCALSLKVIKVSTKKVNTFLEVMTLASTGVIDSSNFHDWVVRYIVRHEEDLKNPDTFQSILSDKSSSAGYLCSTFISVILQLHKSPAATITSNALESLPTPSSWESSSPYQTSHTASSSRYLTPDPPHRRPYSYSPDRSPCPDKTTSSAKPVAKKQRYQPTVEDGSETK